MSARTDRPLIAIYAALAALVFIAACVLLGMSLGGAQ